MRLIELSAEAAVVGASVRRVMAWATQRGGIHLVEGRISRTARPSVYVCVGPSSEGKYREDSVPKKAYASILSKVASCTL